MKTINVYTIEEIKNTDEEVYKEIIEKTRDYISHTDIDFDMYAPDAIYDFTESLKQKGFYVSECEVRCSVGYSQGDGASFLGYVDILEVIDNYNFLDVKTRWQMKNMIDKGYISEYVDIIDVYMGNYRHELTATIDEIEVLKPVPKDEKLKELLKKVEYEIQSIRIDLCKELYNSLCGVQEWVSSDEYILDLLLNDEKYFTAEGKEV